MAIGQRTYEAAVLLGIDASRCGHEQVLIGTAPTLIKRRQTTCQSKMARVLHLDAAFSPASLALRICFAKTLAALSASVSLGERCAA